MARKDCFAFNKYCGNCGIKGHFKVVCQRKNIQPIQPILFKATIEPHENKVSNYNQLERKDPSIVLAMQDFWLAPNTIGQK